MDSIELLGLIGNVSILVLGEPSSMAMGSSVVTDAARLRNDVNEVMSRVELLGVFVGCN